MVYSHRNYNLSLKIYCGKLFELEANYSGGGGLFLPLFDGGEPGGGIMPLFLSLNVGNCLFCVLEVLRRLYVNVSIA